MLLGFSIGWAKKEIRLQEIVTSHLTIFWTFYGVNNDLMNWKKIYIIGRSTVVAVTIVWREHEEGRIQMQTLEAAEQIDSSNIC